MCTGAHDHPESRMRGWPYNATVGPAIRLLHGTFIRLIVPRFAARNVHIRFSVQLCTLRLRRHNLADTRELPADVLQVLAPQLRLLPMPLTDYPQDDKTRTAHHERICQYLGFARCVDTHRQHLVRYLT